MSHPSEFASQVASVPAPGSDWIRVMERDALGSDQVVLAQVEGLPARGLLLWLVEGEPRAFLNRCAHFGVPLAQQSKHLIYRANETISCNVHYARYDWNQGRCVSGECSGRNLVAVPVQILDNGVWVCVNAVERSGDFPTGKTA